MTKNGQPKTADERTGRPASATMVKVTLEKYIGGQRARVDVHVQLQKHLVVSLERDKAEELLRQLQQALAVIDEVETVRLTELG